MGHRSQLVGAISGAVPSAVGYTLVPLAVVALVAALGVTARDVLGTGVAGA